MSENGATPGIDLEAMTRQWQDLMVDSWGKMTKQMVGSDTFAAASSAYLDWALAFQKQMRNNTGQLMDSLEIPKRSDIARISKQVMAVELRIADMEDRLDKVTGLLAAMSDAMQKMVAHSVATASQPAPQEVAAKTAPASKTPPSTPTKSATPRKASPAKKKSG